MAADNDSQHGDERRTSPNAHPQRLPSEATQPPAAVNLNKLKSIKQVAACAADLNSEGPYSVRPQVTKRGDNSDIGCI